MRRIFGAFAYGPGPRNGCWWDDTCALPDCPQLQADLSVDVAVIGGGFTGLSAARLLSRAGVRVAVLEAQAPGWGASGRNGGFCCLGGGKVSDAELDRRFGKAARLEYRRSEIAAVRHVERVIESLGLEVDRHSEGETVLAHRAKDLQTLRHDAGTLEENYGVRPQIIGEGDLAAQGMSGAGFLGALTMPIGFALNPRKLLAGLLKDATAAGAMVFAQSPVQEMTRSGGRHVLTTPSGQVSAEQIIVATNGYSSEDIPPELAGRYMPAQSTVLVTRPLTEAERLAQGWTTGQMCYDTRNLLHYFRLMPDGRFLFGMRGGLLSSPRAEAVARGRTRRDFERMFPRWAGIESTHSWSGMVCLARNKIPFVGALPKAKGLWAALCYHGNGVAMGCYAGHSVAGLVLGQDTGEIPRAIREPLAAFPFGLARRALMPPLYAALRLRDRL